MMRTAELAKLAERFQIKFITIRDLQEYRKCHDKLVDQVTAVNLPTKYGTFRAYGFVSRLNGEHHIALVKVTLAMEGYSVPRPLGMPDRRYIWLFAL